MTRSLTLPPVQVPVEPRGVVRTRAQNYSRIVGVAMTLALVALAGRGAWLCTRPHPLVVELGASQRYDEVVLYARRGQIFDREGRRLATSVDTPSVAVDPSLILEAERGELAAKVAPILGLPVEEVLEKFSRKSRYVKLATRVHPRVAEDVQALHHDALWAHTDPRRYYPEESLLAQVIGFVDNSGKGQSGLESSLDKYLRGKSIVAQRKRVKSGLDFERPLNVGGAADKGMDVHTTIDRQIQRIAERALQGVIERSAPVAASAMVVDIHNGDILAMANVPTFNPNAISDDPEPRKNHLVVDAIEPGSTFKPFTIAAAVEEGVAQPDTKMDCENGSWAIGRSRIRDDHGKGLISLTEVMKYSSNICTAKLAFKMGAEKFDGYLHKFGFEQRTGIQLPGERQGFLRDPGAIKPIELATTSFGQGATATPLQLVMGVATIANGGVRMKPRLVQYVDDAHGVPDFVQRPTEVMRAISAETARKVTEMMITVTEEGGTGTRARVPGYAVAGKTGTAQKVKDGKYSEARISSFVGFLPARDPVVAIIVVVDEPSIGSRYGGLVAGPAFAEIGEATMRHLGVPPDPALLQEVSKKPKAEAVASAAPAVDAEPAELVFADLGGGWRVPNFRGRSLRDVLASAQGTGLLVEAQGQGVAVAQSPAPGDLAPFGTALTVTFQ